MTKTWVCIYHFLLFNWYIFINHYISLKSKTQLGSKVFQDGGRWKYLTILNLTIFFGVACLDDVLKRITGRKTIKLVTAFRDLLFTTLAFPASAFIFLAFWSIFLYNRELIYPKAIEGIFPAWLNHAMHTTILPFSLGEIILRPYHYPSRKTGLTLLAAAGLAYIGRVLWLYFETGTWVYPVFAQLSPFGLAVFFSLSYVLLAAVYLLGEKLNQWKWGYKDAEPRTQVPQEEKTSLQETADSERD